jgi:MinD-like ATPase involved in chromosome partitioning or flagellar assembly
VLIPSDREIPRTVNEGIPIVLARPQSEPAEAFGHLAELLAGPAPVSSEGQPVPALSGAGAEASAPPKRRLLRRKG